MKQSGLSAEQRREQIIEVATNLFAEVGYRSTSLRDIAAAVGITHPGLLYHFHTKEELLQAVLQRREDVGTVRFHLEPERATQEPMALLVGTVGQIAHNQSEERGLTSLFSMLAAEATDPQHPAHDFFAHRYTELVETTAATITALREQGAFVDDCPDPRLLAQSFVAMWDGLQLQYLYDPAAVPMLRILVGYINVWLREPLDPSADWTDLEYLGAMTRR